MSNFKGTKGKWEIKHSESKDAFNICGVLVGGKYKVARIPYLVIKSSMKLTEQDKNQAQYDAQLIAHAPEMLEMLEEMQSLCDLIRFPTEDELGKMNLKLKNLINKITEI